MNSIPRVNWTNAESYTFLNPKLPAPLMSAIESYKLPHLLAHIWLASSGTTSDGEIQWIALSKRAILSSAEAVNTHLKATSKDVWLNTLPHFHVGGLGIFARAHLLKNKVIDISTKPWDPQQFVKNLQEYKVTLTSLVPTQIYDLCRLGQRCPESVRAIVVGGAHLDPQLYKKARQWGYPLLPSFGMTEFSSQIATAEISSLLEKNDFSFPKLKILSHCQVKVAEEKLGQGGRLSIRGPALCSFVSRLSNKEVLSEQMLHEGQWYQTSDRVQVQGDYIQPLGRVGDFLKISGELVNLAELRKLLFQVMTEMNIDRPETRSTLVTRKDARRGNALAMIMEKKLWNQGDEIVRRWNAKVLPVAHMREIYFINQLPQTALGKTAMGSVEKQVFPALLNR